MQTTWGSKRQQPLRQESTIAWSAETKPVPSIMIFITPLIIIAASIPATIGVATIHIRKLILKMDRREVRPRNQHRAVQALQAMDNPCDLTTAPVASNSPNPVTRNHLQQARRHKYASKMAALCTATLVGVEIKTEANRAVIAHFVNQQMALDNVRLVDRTAIRECTIMFVFTPTRERVYYNQLAQSEVFIDREVAGTRQYRSTRSWLDWFDLRFKDRRDPIRPC